MEFLLANIFGNILDYYEKTDYSLPLFLKDGREFYNASVNGRHFVIVRFKEENRFNITVLKKQNYLYIQKLNVNIAYGFDRISSFQRKSLVENGIPFISENGQMFLPFLGVYFDRCTTYEEYSDNRFLPATQILFLLLLYGRKVYSKNVAARLLNVSPMSVTRASKQLLQHKLISEEKRGTEIFMSVTNVDRRAYYEEGKPYLINPVQSVIYEYNYARLALDVPEAGEYGLSLRSDLGYSDYIEYAFYKDDPFVKNKKGVDPNYNDPVDLVRIQKWKYDPMLFSLNGKLDPVSLICCLDDVNDERIHKCLKQVEEEIETWQIILN